MKEKRQQNKLHKLNSRKQSINRRRVIEKVFNNDQSSKSLSKVKSGFMSFNNSNDEKKLQKQTTSLKKKFGSMFQSILQVQKTFVRKGIDRQKRKEAYNEDLGSSASISLEQLSEDEQKVEEQI